MTRRHPSAGHPHALGELETAEVALTAEREFCSQSEARHNARSGDVQRDYAFKCLLHENLVQQITVSVANTNAEKLEFFTAPEAFGREISDALEGLRSCRLEVNEVGTIWIDDKIVKVVQVEEEPLHELLLSEGATTLREGVCSRTPAHTQSPACSSPQMREGEGD